MDAQPGIPCIIYAAKSSEDKRGSIRDQLRECREAIEPDPQRYVVAEYEDEAFSAYRRDRGPDLRDAMQHAEELASERGTAELWALHSDRLARGDGRSARHAVEIALWALKRDVKVRTVQDPDTFRDLLYAVVTGQRNHEDSRRKGLAVAAGHRRAVQRGDYTGSSPDGYRRAIAVDEHGNIKRWLEIDPVRQPLIEKIFAMALRGRGTGEIARAVSDEGWLTKPLSKSQQPKPWTIHCVRGVLKNPRYAGLAVHRGEVLASGRWPAYISEREHKRIQAKLKARRPGTGPRRREAYLLSRLARCGGCGAPMHCVTGELRDDETFARRYVCSSSHWHRHSGRCPARRVDADLVEAMFVSVIGALLMQGSERAIEPAPGTPAAAPSSANPFERERVREAVLGGDDRQIDAALEALLARMSPEAAMLQRVAATGQTARQLELARRLGAWASSERAGRTEATRSEARALNHVLKRSFSSVELAIDFDSVVIVAHPRSVSGAGSSPGAAKVRFDRREWTRSSPLARRRHRLYAEWQDSEILGALQAWADVEGHAPRAKDWRLAGPYYPSSSAVLRHFGSWRKGLIRAGLRPTVPHTRPHWDDDEILRALRTWTARHGRPPAYADWAHATSSRPGTSAVANHFGSWRKGLVAAGLLGHERS